jgi:integrase/recombinase XerD
MDCDAILAFWADYATASGYRKRTVKEHTISLRAVLRRTGKSILTVTRNDLISDLGREGIMPATRARYKSLFYGFWSWVQDEQFRLDNPAARLPKVRVIKAEANPIETRDLEQLLASGIYTKTRMYALLYAYQGYRAAEIAAVHGGRSIDWNNRRILSIEGKGGKEVWRPLHQIVWNEAQKYPRHDFWFPSPTRSEKHVTGKNISTVLSAALKRADIIGHRPHNLRAWYATQLSESGASTAVIAAGLRHSDMQSVPRYLRVADAAIAAAQDRLPLVTVPQQSGRMRRAA